MPTRATSSSCAQLCGPAARHVTEAALDANCSALAAFCSQLLGWSVGHEEPGTTVLVASPSPILIVFQQAADYLRPVWPPSDRQQRPMMHFDSQVADLDDAVNKAIALGETVARSVGHGGNVVLR